MEAEQHHSIVLLENFVTQRAVLELPTKLLYKSKMTCTTPRLHVTLESDEKALDFLLIYENV